MPVLPADALSEFTRRIFCACGAPDHEAGIVADHLVNASLMGIDSHGLMRIPQYVREVRGGEIRPGSPLSIVKETTTTAVVDCGWNFGQVGALRAIEVAVEKARKARVACIVTQRCGHAGRLGAYTQGAAERGFIALGFCNSPRHGHFVLPWGGREGRLATNPLSYAIPTFHGKPILADFSTAAAPEGKIRLYRDQGKRLPEGWIVDGQGTPSSDPGDFYGPPRGAIRPFGGETGYRGFALGLLVEILAGALGGQDITVDQPGNGLAFVAVAVAAFLRTEEFHALIEKLGHYIRSTPSSEGFTEVMLPGDPEYRLAESRRRDGIPIEEATWWDILGCARSLGVEWRSGPGVLATDRARP